MMRSITIFSARLRLQAHHELVAAQRATQSPRRVFELQQRGDVRDARIARAVPVRVV